MKNLLRFSLLLAVGGLLLFAVPKVAAEPLASSGGWSVLGTHVVQSGETLYCIGRAYGVDPWAIATHNGIVCPNCIYPGTSLEIPDAPTALPAGPVCVPQFGDGGEEPVCEECDEEDLEECIDACHEEHCEEVECPEPCPSTPCQTCQPPACSPCGCEGGSCRYMHVVTYGDTLTKLSMWYGVDMWSIAQCNNLANLNYIRIGQPLCIP